MWMLGVFIYIYILTGLPKRSVVTKCTSPKNVCVCVCVCVRVRARACKHASYIYIYIYIY